MASGYFPETNTVGYGKTLTQAAALIREVIEDWQENRGMLCPEDAAQDQSYVDGLWAAIEKIEECVKPDESDPAVLEKLIAAAEKRQDQAEAEADRLRSIRSHLRAKAMLDKIEADARK